MEAAVARARQALEGKEPIEVNTRLRLLAMVQALFLRCKEYHAAVEQLQAELRAARLV